MHNPPKTHTLKPELWSEYLAQGLINRVEIVTQYPKVLKITHNSGESQLVGMNSIDTEIHSLKKKLKSYEDLKLALEGVTTPIVFPPISS